ncbi:Brp/Blh family beta-carotene 15,15'-dioxygenase [Alteriqipengyuania sp. 357]
MHAIARLEGGGPSIGPLLTGGAIVLALLAQLAGGPWALAAAVVLFAAGLFHGAGDESADTIRRFTSLRAVAYVIVAGGVAALYLAAPLAGLSMFLLLSAWHFATSECGFDRVSRYAIAGLAIGGSVLFQPHETARVFAAITGASFPAEVLLVLAGIGIAGTGCALLASARRAPGAAHALAAILATAFLAPALAVALIFFAAHALPIQLRQIADHGRRAVLHAVAPTGVIALLGACVLVMFVYSDLVPLSLASALAFGLATPHMLGERLDPAI